MEMIQVNSSAIDAIGYTPATQQLKIKFNQGHTYTFFSVPQHIFDSFLSASSKGVYYSRHIKGKYQG